MLAASSDPQPSDLTRIALRPGTWVKRKDATWNVFDPFT
jgi:hypothetical protein